MKKYIIPYLVFTLLLAISTQQASAHFTTKGPYGGSVSCMLAADTMIYIGTKEGGVFKSVNAGATSWKYANYTGLADARINALAVLGRYVYAATPTGIFRSSDQGNAWSSATTGLEHLNVHALIAYNHNLFAGTDAGAYISQDSGSTWSAASSGMPTTSVHAFAYLNGMLYAATDAGVCTSTSNGGSWNELNSGLTGLAVQSLAVSGNMVLATSQGSVFKLDASGTTWSNAMNGMTKNTVNAVFAYNNVLYAATENGVYTTSDQTIAWAPATAGYAGATSSVLLYGGKLYAGTKGEGIYRSASAPAISWSAFNNGFNNLSTYAVYNSGLLVVAATNKGLFVSRDLAANYVASASGISDSTHITDLAFTPTTWYAATEQSGIYSSNDSGLTWTAINTGLGTPNISKLCVSATRIFAAAANGNVYSTLIGAINWQLTSGLPFRVDPTALVSDGTAHAFLGTSGNGVFMCMDGATWTASNTNLPNLNVTSLAILNGMLYASTRGAGVHKSALMGSWSAAGNGLPTDTITSLCASGAWVAAGYRGGVYVTTDNGTTWRSPNVLMYIPSYAEVNAISFTTASTRIFAGTPHNSLYSNSLSELPSGIAPAEVNTAGSFGISPNPARSVFRIDTGNLHGVVKSLAVYDLNGNLVYQTNVGKGQSLAVDTQLLPGMYVVHVATSEGVAAQRLVVE